MTVMPLVRDLGAGFAGDRRTGQQGSIQLAEVVGLSSAQTRKRVIGMAAQLPSMAHRLQAEVQADFRVFVQHWREALVEVFSAALTRAEERSPKTKMDS